MFKDDKLSEQMKLLNITEYPFSSRQLSESFKKEIMQYHPDKYKGKDAEEKSIAIINAYNDLKTYTDDFIKKVSEIDKKSMFEFTKPCKHCDGKGYDLKEIKVKGYDCIKCKDTGYFSVKCNKCDNGKFTLKSGRKVECLTCKGTGIFRVKCNHKVSFERQFWHNMFSNKNEYVTKRFKCEYCNGTGEEVWEPINPVIRKGAILK